jgi:hypothetical protein
LLGVNRAASRGVFVKIRNPHRTSAERRDSSNVGSVNGFFGKSQAVTIVVREEMSGPASAYRAEADLVGLPPWVQAMTPTDSPRVNALALKQPVMRKTSGLIV